MARREYSEETKAAVMAALLTGQSISAVAKEYQIPRGTVAAWSSSRNGTVQQPDADTKKEIGALLIEYLKASLRTLAKQVEFFGDETWLRKQEASQVAVLHGVSADKVIRLLESLADDGNEEDSEKI
jgi:transposase-like protein